MNDEGVGIAGWLLADLALVLAIVFLAFTPAALSDDSDIVEATATPTPTPTPEPTIAAPVILDLGCKGDEQAAEVIAIRCEPLFGGGEVDSYRWEAEGGRARGYIGGSSFAASFAGAGAVRLTAANAGGEHSAAFPVLPPPVPVPVGSEVLTDFRFDQIVLENARLGAVAWADIKAGGVRENLIKREEDEPRSDAWSSGRDVEDLLRAKRDQGLRIALVETFAHERSTGHVALAREVNDVFYEGLVAAGMGDIFVDCVAPRENWFADYLNTSRLRAGEVRINVFFVRPRADAGCS